MYENTPQNCVMFYGRISNVSGGICPLMSEKLAHWSVLVRLRKRAQSASRETQFQAQYTGLIRPDSSLVR